MPPRSVRPPPVRPAGPAKVIASDSQRPPGCSGAIAYGGWFWRYALAPEGAGTVVTLTYDWSFVPASGRAVVDFPPFGREHLENSLAHPDELGISGSGTGSRADAGTS